MCCTAVANDLNSMQAGRRGRRPLQLNGVATLVAVTFSLSFVNINTPINQNMKSRLNIFILQSIFNCDIIKYILLGGILYEGFNR